MATLKKKKSEYKYQTFPTHAKYFNTARRAYLFMDICGIVVTYWLTINETAPNSAPI